MSAPAPGNYYIVNRLVSIAGRPLALTYDGNNAVVTATDLLHRPTQAWTLRDHNGRTQSVSPQGAPQLQIGMGDGVIKVLPAHGYVWTIRGDEGVYTVQDGGVTVYWILERAVNGEPVSYGEGTGDAKQNWVLIPVA